MDPEDRAATAKTLKTTDATKLPGAADVWRTVMALCGLHEVLALEQTCNLLHTLASDRRLWLRLLHSLDQAHAPAVPRHIPVSVLAQPALKAAVVNAHKRYERAFGIDSGASKAGLFKREEVVQLDSILLPSRSSNTDLSEADADAALLRPLGAWGTECLLLPDGAHLLVRWPAGYLQCFATRGAPARGGTACLWTYPPLPSREDLGAGAVQPLIVCAFAAEMCPGAGADEEGAVNVLVVSDVSGGEPDMRRLEVLRFTPANGRLTRLYADQPRELDVWHGLALYAHIRGDVLVVYTEGHLHVAFWQRNASVLVYDCIIDSLEIVDDYLICVRGAFDGNMLTAIPIAALEALVEADMSPESFSPASSSLISTITTTIIFTSSSTTGTITRGARASMDERPDQGADEDVDDAYNTAGVPKVRGEVRLAELPTTDAALALPREWLVGRAMLSVCDFHWQAGAGDEDGDAKTDWDEKERDVSVTVLLDVYHFTDQRDFPIADYFVFKRRGDADEDLTSKRRRKQKGPRDRDSSARFVRTGRSHSPSFPSFLSSPSSSAFEGPSARVSTVQIPSPATASPSSPAASTAASPPNADPNPSAPQVFNAHAYSLMAPPSQAGAACIVFHDDHDPTRARYARTLALFVPGREVTYCPLEEAIAAGAIEEGRRPATYGLYLEYYSGAVYYVTEDMRSVVIKYFD